MIVNLLLLLLLVRLEHENLLLGAGRQQIYFSYLTSIDFFRYSSEETPKTEHSRLKALHIRETCY